QTPQTSENYTPGVRTIRADRTGSPISPILPDVRPWDSFKKESAGFLKCLLSPGALLTFRRKPGSIPDELGSMLVIRYTLRQPRLLPVFSLAAILTLALGIGGTTAIFTLINAVMLRSLPVSDPKLLYRIGSGDDCCGLGGLQDHWGLFSYSFYQRLAAASPE